MTLRPYEVLAFAVAFVSLLLAFGVSNAVGQQRQMIPVICMPMDVADKTARKEFGEIPFATGEIVEGNDYILFYRNPTTKSFTVFSFTAAKNQACVLASGGKWKVIKDNRSDL